MPDRGMASFFGPDPQEIFKLRQFGSLLQVSAHDFLPLYGEFVRMRGNFSKIASIARSISRVEIGFELLEATVAPFGHPDRVPMPSGRRPDITAFQLARRPIARYRPVSLRSGNNTRQTFSATFFCPSAVG